jgi:hypothetical protein
MIIRKEQDKSRDEHKGKSCHFHRGMEGRHRQKGNRPIIKLLIKDRHRMYG